MTYDEQCRLIGLAGRPMDDLCQWDAVPAVEVLDAPVIGPAVLDSIAPSGQPLFLGGVWSDKVDLDPLAVHFVSAAKALVPAPPDTDLIARDMPGTWLYGGGLQRHFGHFLTESLGRLWALDLPEIGPVAGVIWVPMFDGPAPAFVTDSFAQLQGLPNPVILTDQVQRPERLIVARQEVGSGFGLLARPDAAQGLRRRFAAKDDGVAPEDAVYVSRSKLLADNPALDAGIGGQLLPGRWLDDVFHRAGYQVFHPERASIAQQILTYRNARVLVVDESSALHLIALVAGPQTCVIVLCRRPWYRFLLEAHLRIYLGDGDTIFVRMVEGRNLDFGDPRSVFVVPDMALLADLLVSAGAPPISPGDIPADHVDAAIGKLRTLLG